jgi:hypothetical protein
VRKIATAFAVIGLCVSQQGYARMEAAKSDANLKLSERATDLRAFYCLAYFTSMFGESSEERAQNLRYAEEAAIRYAGPSEIDNTKLLWGKIIGSYGKIMRFSEYRLGANDFDEAVYAYALSEYKADADLVSQVPQRALKICAEKDRLSCTKRMIKETEWSKKTNAYCMNADWLEF